MELVALIVVLVTAVAAAIYAFRTLANQQQALSEVAEWLQAERASHWEALPRYSRIFKVAGVERLRRGVLNSDSEFDQRYEGYEESKRRHVGSIVLLVAVVALIWVAGTAFDLP